MDPETSIRDLFNNPFYADEVAYKLKDWLSKDGFVPELDNLPSYMRKRLILALCNEIIEKANTLGEQLSC